MVGGGGGTGGDVGCSRMIRRRIRMFVDWVRRFFPPKPPPIARVTIVTRRDLSPGQQAVQSAHAFHQFLAAKYREKREVDDSCTLVFLTVQDEGSLGVLTKRAADVAIDVATFHEPDLDNALTAIALGHGARNITKGLPLALSEPKWSSSSSSSSP